MSANAHGGRQSTRPLPWLTKADRCQPGRLTYTRRNLTISATQTDYFQELFGIHVRPCELCRFLLHSPTANRRREGGPAFPPAVRHFPARASNTAIASPSGR